MRDPFGIGVTYVGVIWLVYELVFPPSHISDTWPSAATFAVGSDNQGVNLAAPLKYLFVASK